MNSPLTHHVLRIIPPQSPGRPRSAEECARVRAMQQLRGAAYVADGALPPEALDGKGRHLSEHDDTNFHVLTEHADGTLAGGLRARVHAAKTGVENLQLWPALARMSPDARQRHEQAIAEWMAWARQQALGIGEVSGWAVRAEDRSQHFGLEMPLSGFAFFELLGSALVIAHATHRHRAAQILKHMGGWSLSLGGLALDPLFDPGYGCVMEFVCFCSRTPVPEFAGTVARLQRQMADSDLRASADRHRQVA